jgi:hypothetical protein
MAIWYILWPIGIFCGHLLKFCPFWYVVPRKIWQPWPNVKLWIFQKTPQSAKARTPTVMEVDSEDEDEIQVSILMTIIRTHFRTLWTKFRPKITNII